MLIPMPATREEWLAMRMKYVGASEVAALFGVQAPYQMDHFALHMVKAGRADPPYVGGERIKWGQRLEEVVALGIGEEYGYPIAKGRYAIADDCAGMGCSLDFEMAFDPTGEFDGPGVLETKNVDWLVHKRSWTDGEPPIHILLQNQHQLGCTNYTWGAVGALVGGNELKLYRYGARPDLIADIKSRVTKFWADVQAGENPDPSWSESSADVLRAMYPETVDELADLRTDNELPDICARMLDAADRRKAAQKAEDEAKNQLIAKLGPNRRAMVQGYWVNTSVTPERPASVITQDMVGQPISGRKEVRRYTVKPMEDQEMAA